MDRSRDVRWNLRAIFFEGSKSNTSEARTRNFLRRTGGLRRVRGNVSPLTDCPISAAWWRYRTATDVSRVAQAEGEDLDVRAAHDVLHNKEVWSNLVTMSLKRVTAVNAPRARAAAVAALRNRGINSSQVEIRTEVQSLIRRLAGLSYGYNLEFLPWSQLVSAASDGFSDSDADEVIVEDDDSKEIE